MYETPILTILFPLLIVGMPITMIISYIFVEMPRNTVYGDHRLRAASAERLQKRKERRAQRGTGAKWEGACRLSRLDVIGLGTPRAACEAEVLGHDQAQQIEPQSAQQASRIGWENMETARHKEERDLVRHHTGA